MTILGPRQPLTTPWPTVDPFLFCVHHVDAYPAGDRRLGPTAPLDGRQLGNDFAGKDGWRMYHGQVVPGFPGHPHRGFESVTYVRRGHVDHSDSLGATARFGRGDVQWLTAGSGIVHAEMFPLLDPEGPNPLELFQIWVNLPAADKMADPHFAMLWDEDIPRVVADDGRVEVTVIAGALEGATPPPPPPASWASHPEAEVAIWHVRLGTGGRWTMPPARGDATVRSMYVMDGTAVELGSEREVLEAGTGATVRADEPVVVASADGAEAMVLQGRPIAEPVAQYGPFVMNDEAGIRQAMVDYRATGFGGWPWPDEAPVHGRDAGRFAQHADGHVEERAG